MQTAAARATQVRDEAAVIAAAEARKKALEDEANAEGDKAQARLSKGKHIAAVAREVAAARQKRNQGGSKGSGHDYQTH